MGTVFVDEISLGDIAELLGVLVGVAAVVVTVMREKSRDRIAARRDVYQRLEMASIEHFRFESAHPEYVRILHGVASIPEDAVGQHLYRNYLCQMLNLFEMALELHRDGVVDASVLETWVAWFLEVGRAPGFRPVWSSGLRAHYTELLQEIMDMACAAGGPDVARGRILELVGRNASKVGSP